MRLISSASLGGQNISASLQSASFAASAVEAVSVRLFVAGISGCANYTAFTTLARLGTGSAFRSTPITTGSVDFGVTSIVLTTIPIPLNSTDILRIYIQGSASDTTSPSLWTDFYGENNSVLTAQNVRDAMELAPTSGSGAVGSIDYILDEIAINAQDAGMSAMAIGDMTEIRFGSGGGSNYYAFKEKAIESVASLLESGVYLANESISGSTFDNITAFPLASIDSGDTTIARKGADTDTLEILSGQMDTINTNVLAITSSGAGTGVYTDTIRDTNNEPIDGVLVQLSSDSAGLTILYQDYTNALGVFTLRPDPGTYYVWLDHARYNFLDGFQTIVT